VSHGGEGAAPVATLSVAFGRMGAAGVGITATLYDLSGGKRGLLPPAARLVLRGGGGGGTSNADEWEVCEERAATLSFEPEHGDVSSSYRSEMGLLDFKEEVVANKIHVGSSDTQAASLVGGTYVRQRCRGTTVFGALWKREAAGGSEAMWLFVNPDVDRTGPDHLVFGTTPTYRDGRAFHVAELRLRPNQPVLEWLHALGQV